METGRLLIGEGETDTALDLHARLVSLGFEVLGEASTGEALIQSARELQPDLILMDIALQGEIGGIATAQILRTELNIPVLLTSPFSDGLSLQQAQAADPYGLLLKPFDDSNLRTAIEMGISRAAKDRLLRESITRLRESETRYRAIVEEQTDLIVRCLPDLSLTFANLAFGSLFNSPPETLYGRNLEWACPELAEGLQHLLAYFTPDRPVQTYDCKLTLPDGNTRWVQWRARGIYSSPNRLSEIQAVGRDISAAKKLEELLRDRGERYYLAAEGANDGIWDWDLHSGSLYFSPRLKETLGYANDEIGEKMDEWLALIHADDLAMVKQAFSDHLDAKTPILQQEFRLRRKDGSYGWFALRGQAVGKPERPPHRVAGSLNDITRQKDQADALSFKAFHDSLTGLANRSLFLNRLQHVLDRYRMPRKGLAAVLFLDLDFFKLVNDSLGHQTGDALLVRVARRLEETLRPSDTIARFGGDEFAILIEDITSLEEALVVAQRIQQQLTTPFQISNKDLYISASIGIADTSMPDTDPNSIMRNADIAMYLAKEKGRGRHEIFNLSARQEIRVLLDRDQDLERALEQNELHLLYQPIFCRFSQSFGALEAIPHWDQPGTGLLQPKDFLETVVDSALIERVTAWELNTACSQLVDFQRSGFPELDVTLDLTLSQIALANLEDLIASALETSGLGPDCLQIGIGETVAAGYPAMLGQILAKISSLRARVVINGFGRRYTFLSELGRLPVERLKIERDCLGENSLEEEAARARALVELGCSYHLAVGVDGLDTPAQFGLFQGLNCDQLQGSWISPPLSSADMARFLANPPGHILDAL